MVTRTTYFKFFRTAFKPGRISSRCSVSVGSGCSPTYKAIDRPNVSQSKESCSRPSCLLLSCLPRGEPISGSVCEYDSLNRTAVYWTKITSGDSYTSTGFIPYVFLPSTENPIGNPPYPVRAFLRFHVSHSNSFFFRAWPPLRALTGLTLKRLLITSRRFSLTTWLSQVQPSTPVWLHPSYSLCLR